MPSPQRSPGTLALVTQVSGLLLFGIALERGFTAFERWIPRDIYFESSFTLALFSAAPLLLVPVLLASSPAPLALLPARALRTDVLGWSNTDSIGGLRWFAFSLVVALCWSYAAYPYNYYYGQAHLLDRWLVVLLALGTLRSPLLIPLFLFELMISRGQLRHPINSLAPITEELPIRLLCIIAGLALWNLVASSQRFANGSERTRRENRGSVFSRIPTHVLVYALLCILGCYYGFAGIAKLTIGESLLDWARDSHMENLFVGAYLNGWPLIDSQESLLSMARIVRNLSVPIATATILLECGMIFVLAHRVGTIVLVGSILMMHLGIVAMTGIFFWQWVVVDISLAIWLWWIREDETLGAIYSTRNAVASVLIIVTLIWTFGVNRFTWWNTKWYSVLEVEVLDDEGRRYRVDYGDFYPFLLIDFLQPDGAAADTIIYGMTFKQELMNRIETTNPRELRAFLRQQRAENISHTHLRTKRNVENFMLRYFRNRNRLIAQGSSPGHHVFPFIVSAPLSRMRYVKAANLYDDRAPVVEVKIRHVETYYTGESLVPFAEQVIATIAIPSG